MDHYLIDAQSAIAIRPRYGAFALKSLISLEKEISLIIRLAFNGYGSPDAYDTFISLVTAT